MSSPTAVAKRKWWLTTRSILSALIT
jgi:hypothetical protein